MLFFLISLLINPQYPTHGMGAKFTPENIAKRYLLSKSEIKKMSNTDIPSKVDLCNELPRVETQGAQGSCVAWAVGYYYKTFQETKEKGLNANEKDNICSPTFIYNQINSGNDNGSFPLDAANLIRTSGCASWTDMPYDDTDTETLPNITQQLSALKMRSKGLKMFYHRANSATTGKRYTPVDDDTIQAMKAHLASGDAFVISIPIFDDFHTSHSGFYDLGEDAVTERNGGHALVVCGYDDAAGDGKGGFRIKNSWGTNWGVDGLSYLSYDFMKYFSGEALYMIDRIDYKPKVVAEIKIDDIPRSQLNFMTLGEEGHAPLVDFLSGDFRTGFDQIIDLTDMKATSFRNYYFNFLDFYPDNKKGIVRYIRIKNYDDSLIHSMDNLDLEMPDQGDVDIIPGGFGSLHYDKNGYDFSFMGGEDNKTGYLGVEFYFVKESRVWGVDFFNPHIDSKYTLSIYKTKDSFLNKDDAIYTKTGEMGGRGWYSIKVDKFIPIAKRDNLFIIVKYENEEGNVIPIDAFPVEGKDKHSYYSVDGDSFDNIEYSGKIRVRYQEYEMFKLADLKKKVDDKSVTVETSAIDEIVSTKLDCDGDGEFEINGKMCFFYEYGPHTFYVKSINKKGEWNITPVLVELVRPKPNEGAACNYSNGSNNSYIFMLFLVILFIRKRKIS